MDNGQTAQTDDKTGELLQFPQDTQNNQATWDIQQDRDPRSTGSSVLSSSMAPNTPGKNTPGGTSMMPPGGNVVQFGQPDSSEMGKIINMEMPPGAEEQNLTPTDEINTPAETPEMTGAEVGEPEVLDKKEEHDIKTIEGGLEEGTINLADFYDKIRDIVEEQNSPEDLSERKAA